MSFVQQPGMGQGQYNMVLLEENHQNQFGANQMAPGMPGAHLQNGPPIVYTQIPPPGVVGSWMQQPQAIPGCPVGLEYLSQIDSLQVKQEVSLTEVVTGFDTNNKYKIMNQMGMQVYFANEESGGCERQCCGNKRSFLFHVSDNYGSEVMRISREFKCCGGSNLFAFCCDCAAYEVQIESPVGTPIGYVKQIGSFFINCYHILDENREPILQIEAPCCVTDGVCCCCCYDKEFKLLTLDGNQIGKISKKYSGIIKESTTMADNFGINFPMDLSVKAKASLLGALFLIDFMFFENPPQSNGGSD